MKENMDTGGNMKTGERLTDPDVFKVTIVQVRNGYIVRTHAGQFVYQSIGDAVKAAESFYQGKINK